MKRRTATLLLAATLALTAAVAPARATTADSALVAAMQDRSVPAIAVLVIRDGRIAEQAVRGVRASDAPDSATLADVWHLGSDAKPMTATLIARLVERGVLAWDTPLTKLLPELAAAMRPEYGSVTLVNLLSHTAGLPSEYAGRTWIRCGPTPARCRSSAWRSRDARCRTRRWGHAARSSTATRASSSPPRSPSGRRSAPTRSSCAARCSIRSA